MKKHESILKAYLCLLLRDYVISGYFPSPWTKSPALKVFFLSSVNLSDERSYILSLFETKIFTFWLDIMPCHVFARKFLGIEENTSVYIYFMYMYLEISYYHWRKRNNIYIYGI